LGCVFSEAACYVVLGSTGRDDYDALRKAQIPEHVIKAGYDSCFHDGHSVLPAVREMHDRLRQQRRISDSFLEAVLPIISNMLDSKPADRLKVNHVYKMCKDLTQRAREDAKFHPAFRTASDHTMSPEHPRMTPPQVPPEVDSPAQYSRIRSPTTQRSPGPQRKSSNTSRRSHGTSYHNMGSIDDIFQNGLRISTRGSPLSASPEVSRTHSLAGSPRTRVSFAESSHVHHDVKDEDEDEDDEIEEKYYEYERRNESNSREGPASLPFLPQDRQPTLHQRYPNRYSVHGIEDQIHETTHSIPYVSVQMALTWTSDSRSKYHSAINNETGKLARRDHVCVTVCSC
jgi:hypothetical protein